MTDKYEDMQRISRFLRECQPIALLPTQLQAKTRLILRHRARIAHNRTYGIAPTRNPRKKP